MRAEYITSLNYYTHDEQGHMVKTVWQDRQGYNAKQMHNQAQKDLREKMYSDNTIVCVEVYTCLLRGDVRGYGQPMERCSYRHRHEDRYTHTDF